MYAYYNISESNKTSRTDLNIVIDNVILDNVDSEKILGVIVDKYLTWKHVDKTAKNISKTLPYFIEKRDICRTKPI